MLRLAMISGGTLGASSFGTYSQDQKFDGILYTIVKAESTCDGLLSRFGDRIRSSACAMLKKQQTGAIQLNGVLRIH